MDYVDSELNPVAESVKKKFVDLEYELQVLSRQREVLRLYRGEELRNIKKRLLKKTVPVKKPKFMSVRFTLVKRPDIFQSMFLRRGETILPISTTIQTKPSHLFIIASAIFLKNPGYRPESKNAQMIVSGSTFLDLALMLTFCKKVILVILIRPKFMPVIITCTFFMLRDLRAFARKQCWSRHQKIKPLQCSFLNPQRKKG